MSFVHLHNHTQYSILDGACRIDQMIKLAIEMGMPAVAMTDHGNMYGTIDFLKQAAKAGIKPIVGLEAYVVEHDYDHPDTKNDERYHLVLLVKNETGYKNLLKLSSTSFIDGFYHKPRICKSLLKKHAEGLIALSGCVKGEIPQKILKSSKADVMETFHFYKELFGDDFYLELQNHALENEMQSMPKVIELAKETNTPLVVTNDCHYLYEKDAESHEILLCVQTGKNFNDVNRMKYPPNMYFKSKAEMAQLFPDVPEAMENTLKIAEKINFKIEFGDYKLPKFTLPTGFTDEQVYLKHLCYEAAKRRYGNSECGMRNAELPIPAHIKERIDFELATIFKMGFSSYFLIVKDFIDYANSQGIPVGPGRGSAVGSIVSYLLGITKLCPLKYSLFFERFLNPDRISMPDIDIDFCKNGRTKVIDYVVEKYGRNSVAQIVTFGTLGAKSAIKDAARVMGLPPADANNLTKLMPPLKPNTPFDLDYCMTEPKFAEAIHIDQNLMKIFEHAKFLEGLIRQIGIHAAGVVIGPGNLSDYVPLATNSQGEGERIVMVQYEGSWLDELKLLKMDFLALNNLTIIKKCLDFIKEYKNINLDIDDIDLNDAKAFKLLSQGKTEGIFQLESDGMVKYLKEMKPNKFEDIVAMVALYRPGPMQFIDTYIARKHGQEKVNYEHPLLESTLKETYGVTVYQEQIMQISREIGGLSGGDADTLRKAMGKKNIKLMNEQKEKFYEGAVKNGLDTLTLDNIWDSWLKFAEYAFNKSHSVAYGFIAYQTAYLKANYSVEYMAALLSLEESPKKIPQFIAATNSLNITILNPSINRSVKDFKIYDDQILFGLNAIKNIGSAAISLIIKVRDTGGEFKNFFEFVQRTAGNAVNKATLESLVMAGVLDELPGNRAQKFLAIEHAIQLASTNQKNTNSGQLTIFSTMSDEEMADENPKFKDIPEWDKKTILDHEMSVLGFYLSGHPLAETEFLRKFYVNMTTKDFAEVDEGFVIPKKIRIIGTIINVLSRFDKKGNTFLILSLEDMYGNFEVTMFSKEVEKYNSYAYIGHKILISGTLNTYVGNNSNEKLLKIMPDKIIPVDDLDKKVSGDIIINIDEDDVTHDLANYLKDFCKDNPGRFVIKFKIHTNQAGFIYLRASKLTFRPTKEFEKELTRKRNLSFSCNCEV